MDRVFHSGCIYTGGGFAEAVVARDGVTAFTGSDEDAFAFAGKGAERVDLGGRLMLPGLTDTHMHLAMYGDFLSQCDLFGCTSIDELISRGRKHAEAHASARWLIGAGWDQNRMKADRFPNRFDLDNISTDRPIMFSRNCYHIIAVNTKALELCGIDENTPDVPGGSIERDEHGFPTGVFKEDAGMYVYDKVPAATREEVAEHVLTGAKKALSFGLTTVHSDDLMVSGSIEDMLYAYDRLSEKLPLRVFAQCRLPSPEYLEKYFSLGLGYQKKRGNVTFGPLKLIGDGTLGARTAYMRKPYSDAPDTCGIPCYTDEQLFELINGAALRGMPCAIHAIGDSAITAVLDCIERTGRYKELRNYINHFQITDEGILLRTKRLDVGALYQPVFLDCDMHIAEERVGHEMAMTSYCYRRALHMGIPVAFGSDCPVESCEPFRGIYMAVTRKDDAGSPEGGWNPSECLTVKEAVDGFTSGAAYAENAEHIKGRIATGFAADYTVANSNIFTISPDDIKNVRAAMTVIGGEVAYRAQA